MIVDSWTELRKFQYSKTLEAQISLIAKQQIFELIFEMIGVDVFSMIHSLICEYTDATSIVCQSCF